MGCLTVKRTIRRCTDSVVTFALSSFSARFVCVCVCVCLLVTWSVRGCVSVIGSDDNYDSRKLTKFSANLAKFR